MIRAVLSTISKNSTIQGPLYQGFTVLMENSTIKVAITGSKQDRVYYYYFSRTSKAEKSPHHQHHHCCKIITVPLWGDYTKKVLNHTTIHQEFLGDFLQGGYKKMAPL